MARPKTKSHLAHLTKDVHSHTRPPHNYFVPNNSKLSIVLTTAA